MQVFKKHLQCWNLTPNGGPISTHSSDLLPVIYQDQKAMLKIAKSSEEKRGNFLMAWWSKNQAPVAPVFMNDKDALLMERALGKKSLIQMAKNNQDEKATEIICTVVQKLHSIKNQNSPPSLTPLSDYFRALGPAASQHGGLFIQAHNTAQELLKNPKDSVILHGDIHHGNILYFGDQGWLAIDPKGLVGESYFDFANLFFNPDFEVATQPGRLETQLALVCKMANLDRNRLLKWILAYSGLSAAWHLEDGTDPKLALTIAEITLALILDNQPTTH